VNQIATPETEVRTTRVAFIRRLGTFAAVGLGAAALAKSARAEPTICCPSSSQCPNFCGQGQDGWWCTGACGGCCMCLTGGCHSFNCPCP
jgi:hypothetical protein